MPSTTAILVLVLGGALAGAVGSAGGITSLISYPALLAVGVPPLTASVVNLVAGVASWPGAALTSRRELREMRTPFLPAAAAVAVGGAAGSVLLLTTPPGVFVRVVPFLVLIGSAALVAQPWLTARLHRSSRPVTALGLPLLGLVSLYGGYFGAGSGILVLAVLLVFVDQRLPEANAIKNMLVGVGATVSTLVFVVAGSVPWLVVLPLAVGLFLGSTTGPLIARRVPPAPLRWVVAGLGVVLAVDLWLMG